MDSNAFGGGAPSTFYDAFEDNGNSDGGEETEKMEVDHT